MVKTQAFLSFNIVNYIIMFFSPPNGKLWAEEKQYRESLVCDIDTSLFKLRQASILEENHNV